MTKFLEEKHTITSFQVDHQQKLRLTAAFHLFQEIAYHHAESLRFGFSHLLERNLFWVLSKIKIQISSYPSWQDEIYLRTWPKGTNKFYALRDYEMLDKDHNRIAAITSAWLMVNTNTMMPHRADKEFEGKKFVNPKDALADDLPKFRPKIGTHINSFNRIARFSDIDLNQHVNNAKYIEWVLDAFSLEDHTNRQIEEFQINFLAELKFNQQVNILQYQLNENEFIFEAIETTKNTKIFQANIKFKNG